MVSALKELVWITQLGFSIVSPLLVCILGSAWLQERFSLGSWIILIGLFLGLGGAVSAGITFYRHTRHQSGQKGKKDPPPISFNEHD